MVALAAAVIGLSTMATKCTYTGNPDYDPTGTVIYTDYFKVQLRQNDGYAIVLSLTDLGKQQQILAIPDHINGLPVQQIGWKVGNVHAEIGSPILEKVYVPYTINAIASGALASQTSQETIWMSNVYPLGGGQGDGGQYDLGGATWQGEVYMTKEFYSKFFNIDESDIDSLYLPNLYYYYNYEDAPNLNYFWFDHITSDNLHIDPADPEREGYAFTGWYTDPDCSELWDQVLPDGNSDLELFAGWQKITNQ